MISLPPINLNKITASFNQPDNFLNQPDLVKGTVLILEGQFIVRYQENQQIITKFLSPSAMRQAFNQIPIDTGFLSEGIVRWGINQNGEWLVKFIPPQLTEIQLIEGDKIKSLVIPLPPLIFMGIAHTYYIWAIKTNTFVANAPLFHAHFLMCMKTAQFVGEIFKHHPFLTRILIKSGNFFLILVLMIT